MRSTGNSTDKSSGAYIPTSCVGRQNGEITCGYQIFNLIEEQQRTNLSVEGQEINFRHVIFMMLIKHPSKFV